MRPSHFLAGLLLVLGTALAAAQAPKGKPGAPFAGFGANSKQPIKVDANKLEVFDKENKAVYSGDVVVTQGQTTMRCSAMNVFYSSGATSGRAPAAGAGQNALRRIECKGPVSILSGTQSATAREAVYDSGADTVTLLGSVVIADCDNVQRGERVVYDVKTGVATVDAGKTGRVQGIFSQGSEAKDGKRKDCGPATGDGTGKKR